MKKLLLLTVIILSVQLNGIYAQKDNKTNAKNRVILVNPHVFYLKSMAYLTDNNIVDIENLEYQAIFYTKNEISYDEAEKFVKENGISYISLKKVDGDLNKDNLYQENSCTKSFIELFENSDGIIFLGGSDIPGFAFGQKTSLLADIETPNRNLFELSFLYHLLGRENNNAFKPLLEKNPNYVVYGICLGMQSMNVATGGDMYQDIPSEVYDLQYVEDVLALDENKIHRSYWRNIDTDSDLDNHSFHQIKFIDKQFFTTNYKLDKNYEPYVCSSHHQAVKSIGKGFDVAATSMDGKVVEAIYHNKYKNVLGVQFHPEFFYLHDPESKKFKMKSGDTELMTEHEMLKKLGSYPFHLKYWEYFSN
ncbi:MAG: gamma-glutamyl-gamma-aminobutyrate hydrolase family protein, partial [Bacteroidota bacterium]|nr:gamma-glutamyl-gamma-aminobutyrate hydrolase family protein [Bacteroidota bacterium]